MDGHWDIRRDLGGSYVSYGSTISNHLSRYVVHPYTPLSPGLRTHGWWKRTSNHSVPFPRVVYETTRHHFWPPQHTVLDSSIGKPAQGVKVQLFAPSADQDTTHEPPGAWVKIGASATDSDGRCSNLLPPPDPDHMLQPGPHQIVFETEEYFKRTGRKSFFPFVQVGGFSPLR